MPCRNKKRFNYADRIVSCVDDHIQRNKLLSEDPTSNNKQNTRGMSDCPRVRIRVGDIRSYQSVLASSLVAFPLQHLRALEIAAHDIAQDFRPGYDSKLQNNTLVKIRVALVGPLLISPSSPRDLVSNLLGQLVCVEGVATKVSPSKPKLVKSVHYCEATKRHLDRTYIKLY